MEDPWGSPWAADSPAKIELPVAPQNAHFSADHLFPRRNSRSPAPPSRSRSPAWEDDDAWGGWNGGDASGSGKESPGWGRSPGLKPLQGAPSVRSISPDPWKDVALKRLDTTALENDERKPRERRASEASGDDRVVDSAISLGDEHELQKEEDLKNDIPVVVPPLDIDATDEAWLVEAAPEAPAAEVVIPAIQLEQPDFSLDTGAPVPAAIQLEQPDFSPDTEAPVPSAVDDKEQDEVLFTAEEPAREEEAFAPQKSVEVEDEQQPVPPVRVIEDEVVISGQEIVPPPLDVESEAVAENERQQQEPWDDIPPVPTVSEPNVWQASNTPFESDVVARPASQTSKIHFPIDLTKLDDLFPSTPPIKTEPELVPDVIIDDAFAPSNERRAWYRISRYGSKRKHDLGGDENYVRVSWSKSQIRERTTQTVRRWMEEDSITGRVVLGRRLGGSGAVMFNWNSPAPQVEIGEFLGRHSRNSSLTVQSPVASPTTSSFAWASSGPSSPAASRHPLANELARADAQEAQSPKEPKADSARQSLSLDPPPQHTRAHIPSPIQIPPTYPINKEDDDDWGEMMTATPTTTMSFEDEDTVSNRHSIPPQSSLQFETVYESPNLLASKIEKAPSKRPFSWHLGQTLSKPFKRGGKTPLTPSFPSPLSKPMTPPQVTPTRHTHTMSADTSLVQPSSPRPSLSIADEETVARLLNDIPDLTYMLR
ncbi:hypothetical protein T069G_00365 [Trichoderma breve]|uniref:Glucan 1, 4-alpha-glucosidase n=1 Tax=Trichoderma breve TaxID=2034170 RepID=A0A9W9JQJ5_9HYPO|nr:hypothetical protein T069G_00365 [Trichoderma breve]KAJ4863835.1 hypothetical protein T069G_00365 [Trichoderma breve]